MPEHHYRLRTVRFQPGLRLGIEEGTWASPPFDDLLSAARARLALDRPHSVRVVRDVDGKPWPLSDQEAHGVAGIDHQDELEKFAAEEKAKREAKVREKAA